MTTPGKPASTERLLTYGDYLKVPGLLDLQHCRSSPAHHDELQFIIVHQVYELWFQLILHELDGTMARLRTGTAGAALEALQLLRRVVAIQKLLVAQIHVLETMSPYEFTRFRDHLRPASGFQSYQFREIEFVGGL